MTTTITDIRRMAREAVEAELGDEFFELEPDELDHILRSEEEYLIGICEDFEAGADYGARERDEMD